MGEMKGRKEGMKIEEKMFSSLDVGMALHSRLDIICIGRS
jgi:hypothetical protein